MRRNATAISKAIIICIFIAMLLSCFVSCGNASPQSQTVFEFFDTSSTIMSYANDTEKEFEANCDAVFSLLEEYHKLFDIYHEYSGVNNLCTVNKNAGSAPVQVDQKLIDFLEYAIDICKRCDLETNIAMGAVLRLWHDARTAVEDGGEAYVPSQAELEVASQHTSIESIVIDRDNMTVYITDPYASIDVGAIGKGYAVMKAAELLRESGASSYVLDIGGNICAIGQKPDGNGWITGITHPDGKAEFSARIEISNVSCVTSGDYERFYTVSGVRYHHIIDKDTLAPSTHFSSVSVVCKDSALADALSTALFCMSYRDGMALISEFGNVEVLWIYPSGEMEMTDGFKDMLLD